MLAMLMDAGCCLPTPGSMHSGSILHHKEISYVLSSNLIQATSFQGRQQFVEAHPSNQWSHFCLLLIGFINWFSTVVLFRELQVPPELMNLGGNEPKGLRSPNLN